jgi:NADPH-dependent 2,4-dienoyl-CoA reductase/sulfur reductase-like enzyme
MKTKYSVVVIGGGPAGLAAAVAAYDAGVKDVLILERETQTGGILNQCIHNGFGLTRFKESLSGPEYAARFVTEVEKRDIEVLTETTVLSLSKDKQVTAISPTKGVFTVQADAVILAMGCRERTRGAISIPGTRCAGIFTAGAAQRYVNMEGYMVGKRIVILGSGDIGLIMARRMTLEGAKVAAVCELMPYSGGLNRNIVQCLQDFDIPLLLSHTVSKIHGKGRITGVTISKVDEHLRPIPEESQYIPCDTLLLSCGLIPENELTKEAGIPLDRVTGGAIVSETRETAVPGIFACGNVLHVHDLVDYVSEEAALAGRSAANYVAGNAENAKDVAVCAAGAIRYTVPQRLRASGGKELRIYFRVGRVLNGARLTVTCGDEILVQQKKRHMAPGEMECLVLKPDVVARISGDITVSCEEATK